MRCAACPKKHTCLPPDGPTGDLLFIGEAPGRDEERKQCVFVGKTGQEVNRHYLPLAGMRRETSCFVNAIACLPATSGHKLDAKRRQDIALLESCAETHLHPLIERGRFKALVPMGAFACRAVMGESFNLEMGHGLPAISQWGIPAFPMYHPALGIHEPKKMLMIRTDWNRLRPFLTGKFRQPVDIYTEPDYREVEDANDLLQELDPTQPIACDTESTRQREPYCLTYSQRAGTGRLIRAGNTRVLRVLADAFGGWAHDITIHNWPYDEPVMQTMGVRVPLRRVVDTMLEVFHLGNLPQGLKALAFRELGMVMHDFEDVVVPHSKKRVLDFYNRLSDESWPKPEPELTIDSKTGLWKLYKPQSMSTKLKRFWTDYGKNPDKDVFKMFEDNWEPYQQMLEEGVGQTYPGMCISHVPFDKALHYACRDADATLRLWLDVLIPMRRRVRKVSQELWRYAS